MFIVSKDRTTIVNTRNMTGIFASFEGNAVRAVMANGTKYNLGSYASHELAKAAVTEIARAMYTEASLTSLLSDNEAEAKLGKEDRLYHITGKKTKGHGES